MNSRNVWRMTYVVLMLVYLERAARVAGNTKVSCRCRWNLLTLAENFRLLTPKEMEDVR